MRTARGSRATARTRWQRWVADEEAVVRARALRLSCEAGADGAAASVAAAARAEAARGGRAEGLRSDGSAGRAQAVLVRRAVDSGEFEAGGSGLERAEDSEQ